MAKSVSILPSEKVVSIAEGRRNSNNCRLSPPQHLVHGGEGSQGELNRLGRGQVVMSPGSGWVGAVR